MPGTMEVDRWLLLAVLGIAGMVFFAAGEFLGWFHDIGEFGFWVSLAASIIGVILTASRRQAHAILAGIGIVEKGVASVEENTRAIPHIEENTSDALQVLRDIRDRLPPPPPR